MQTKIRVLLVDDHAILREGLRAFLSCSEDIQVVGEAQDGQEALEKVGSLHPDVVLMDVAMPGMNGLEATCLVCQHYPGVRVLVLSQHEDRQYVMPVLQAGAAGYIFKRALGTELLAAIRTVFAGETYLHPSVSTMLMEEMRGNYQNETREVLTAREVEVLKHVVQGRTSSQIAVTLSLSVKTVEWHRTNMMNKLDLHNVVELVRYALQEGLVQREA